MAGHELKKKTVSTEKLGRPEKAAEVEEAVGSQLN